MRVLLADDCPIEIALLRRLLSRAGHEVVATGSTAHAAVELARECTPELAFVDGRLPGTGCLPLVASLRTVVPGLKVAVIASLDEIDLVRTAVAAGASGAVRRPMLVRQFEESLEQLLAAP